MPCLELAKQFLSWLDRLVIRAKGGVMDWKKSLWEEFPALALVMIIAILVFAVAVSIE